MTPYPFIVYDPAREHCAAPLPASANRLQYHPGSDRSRPLPPYIYATTENSLPLPQGLLARPQPLLFGAETQKALEKAKTDSPPQPLPRKPLKDPKPHWGWHNLKRGLMIMAGLAGIFSLPRINREFHHWTQTQVQQTEAAGKTPETPLEWIAWGDQTARAIPTVRWTMDYYGATVMVWESVFLIGAARKGILKKAIRPSELWASLNKRGITGKNLTVGIVDTGFLPTSTLPAKKVTFYTPNDFTKQAALKDKAGHGTAVANLIANGSPDSKFVVVAYSTPAQEKEMSRKVTAFFRAGIKNPEKMTLEELRRLFRPMIENIANGVIHAIDQGANVVNVSLSVEQAVQMQLMIQRVMTATGKWFKDSLSSADYLNSREYQLKNERYQDFMKRLKELSSANEVSQTINGEIEALYAPWRKALDYAQAKKVPVVVAAGNSGGHNAIAGNMVGNINLLAGFKHPALLVVGSANSEGVVSQFTSEMNDHVNPLVAANGDGELLTTNGARTTLLSFLWSPLSAIRSRLGYEMPKGTSFAAPDLTLLYLKMKGVNPDLTPEEAAEILQETASPAKFSAAYLKTLTQKLEDRILQEWIDTKLKTVTQSPAFKEFLAASMVYFSGSAEKAAALLNVLEFQQTGQTIRIHYDRPLSEREREAVIMALATTLRHFKVDKPTYEMADPQMKALLDEQLKRRVGMGVVNRLEAVAEAERRHLAQGQK